MPRTRGGRRRVDLLDRLPDVQPRSEDQPCMYVRTSREMDILVCLVAGLFFTAWINESDTRETLVGLTLECTRAYVYVSCCGAMVKAKHGHARIRTPWLASSCSAACLLHGRVLESTCRRASNRWPAACQLECSTIISLHAPRRSMSASVKRQPHERGRQSTNSHAMPGAGTAAMCRSVRLLTLDCKRDGQGLCFI